MQPENLFAILSDQTRLRVLMLIDSEGEVCVCELTHALDVSQPKISRHLALMRDAGLVEARREGTWMHYRICPKIENWGRKAISETRANLGSMKRFQSDLEKLRNMENRPGGRGCD